MTLTAIGFDESDVKYSSLLNTRKTWIQFCRDNSTTISDSKPVMIAISSAVYNYLLKQVSVYQKSLTGQPSGGEISEGLSATYRDDDDVYYRFGGGALCDMLKNRYKQIKNCPSTHRNLLSIEISLRQVINNKDKSSIHFTMNVESEEAMDRIYYEFSRKFCNARIQEYVSLFSN